MRLTIDGKETHVAPGATILDAARALGITIPTLCHRDGCRPGTSCMVCVVRVDGLRRLVPACAFPARDGLVVHSEAPDVQAARRAAIELLMGEHMGDCEGPCRRSCPANMDIPTMIRQIAAGDLAAAAATVRRDIALPAVLGRICPAPCEKACRRGRIDQPLSICRLKRFVADTDLAAAQPWMPPAASSSGRRLAIVGAGPAGLAAAYYLRGLGHACVVFDEHAEPGGELRRAVPESVLPRPVLDAEIAVIRRTGAEFRLGIRVGRDVPMERLRADFDAVVLAVGPVQAGEAEGFGVKASVHGVEVDARTFRTGASGVFAVGAAVHHTRMAIRACADGKHAAISCDQMLRGLAVTGEPRRFNCTIGRLTEAEHREVLKQAEAGARVEPGQGGGAGFELHEAQQEARRCLHCDCRKSESCRLRGLVETLGADARRFAETERQAVEVILQHADVVFEPGKCIKCGLCVRLTEQNKEALGLTFVGRGFDLRIGVPLGESLAQALTHTARDVVEACPTGALAWRV